MAVLSLTEGMAASTPSPKGSMETCDDGMSGDRIVSVTPAAARWRGTGGAEMRAINEI